MIKSKMISRPFFFRNALSLFKNQAKRTTPNANVLLSRAHFSTTTNNTQKLPTIKFKRKVKFISTVDEVKEVSKSLYKENFLGFDIEGTTLSRTGKMCLLQFSTENEIFLIDILTLQDDALIHGIGWILENPNITKIMHDCREDSNSLYHQFNIVLDGVFDTQVIRGLIDKKLANNFALVPRMGLIELASKYLKDYDAIKSGNAQALKTHVRAEMKKSPECFETRPLPLHLAQYAALDVDLLFELNQILYNLDYTSKDRAWIKWATETNLSELRNSTTWPKLARLFI